MIERLPILLVSHITCQAWPFREIRELPAWLQRKASITHSKQNTHRMAFRSSYCILSHGVLSPCVVLHMDLLVGRCVTGYHLQLFSLPSPFLARVRIWVRGKHVASLSQDWLTGLVRINFWYMCWIHIYQSRLNDQNHWFWICSLFTETHRIEEIQDKSNSKRYMFIKLWQQPLTSNNQ